MLNLSGNPFAQFIETSVHTNGDGKQQKQQHQQQGNEHKYLQDNESDEIKISHTESLSEDEILAITQNYVAKLINENSENEKTVKKLDKYVQNFNVKKFMKNNPNINNSDMRMILFNETSNLIL